MTEERKLDPELFADFVRESEELIEALIEDVLQLEEEPSSVDLMQRVFRSLHTLKGNAGFLNYAPMVDLSHRAEDLMDLVRNGSLGVTTPLTDALLLVADALRRLLERVADPSLAAPEIEGLQLRLQVLAGQGDAGCEDHTEERLRAPGAPEAADESGVGGEAATSGSGRDITTVRVDVVRIDQIMNQVGELVLERNRMLQILTEARSGSDMRRLIEPLAETASRIHSITGELQTTILKIRMVPVDRVFRKFPRVVRDLAAKLGKQVKLTLIGGETELDKTVADAIVDPLTHLVRNALDHGLETPEERLRAGKPTSGELSLGAAHEGNHILVRVRDDGRGMDPAKIRRKAVSSGMITEEQAAVLGTADTLALLFHQGFSTSDEVSEVSGRGVGLDVVKTRLEEYRGIIELQSEPGVGTEITLKLPLTLAIVPSLLVRVQGHDFAVPLSAVVEVIHEDTHDFHLFHGRAMLRWRDRVLPVMDLAKEFQLNPGAAAAPGRKVVIVAVADKQASFLVDKLMGQEEVVIKTLGGFLARVPGVAGGTIMGDGRVALIMDVAALVGQAHAGSVRLAAA